jgi:phosphoenolpyruvate phosphomutase
MAESQKDITILVDRMAGSKNYGPEKKIDLVLTSNMSPGPRGFSRVDSIKLVTKTGLALQGEKATYEFPGMTFLSLRGVKIFKDVYNRHKGKLKKASLGELLDEIINAGFGVFCTEVDSGWMELHSFADYKLACSLQK